jgi:hypothetical protein
MVGYPKQLLEAPYGKAQGAKRKTPTAPRKASTMRRTGRKALKPPTKVQLLQEVKRLKERCASYRARIHDLQSSLNRSIIQLGGVKSDRDVLVSNAEVLSQALKNTVEERDSAQGEAEYFMERSRREQRENQVLMARVRKTIPYRFWLTLNLLLMRAWLANSVSSETRIGSVFTTAINYTASKLQKLGGRE